MRQWFLTKTFQLVLHYVRNMCLHTICILNVFWMTYFAFWSCAMYTSTELSMLFQIVTPCTEPYRNFSITYIAFLFYLMKLGISGEQAYWSLSIVNMIHLLSQVNNRLKLSNTHIEICCYFVYWNYRVPIFLVFFPACVLQEQKFIK